MPVYVYRKGNEIVEKRSSILTCEKLHRKMYAKGYRQVYSVSKPIVQLSFNEALEETDELLAQADRGEGPLVGMDVKRKDD